MTMAPIGAGVALLLLAAGLAPPGKPPAARDAAKPPSSTPNAPATPAAQPTPTAEPTPAAVPAAPAAPSDEVARLAASANAIGERLLATLQTAQPDATVIVSPASIHAALLLLAQGASPPTDAALAAALGLSAQRLSPAQAAAAYGQLRAQLGSDRVTVAQANGVFAGKGTNLLPEFVAGAEKTFAAKAESVDFSTPAGTDRINAFVAQATADAIPKLLQTLSSDTRFVLVNALYFKGDWAQKFDAAQTRPIPFKRAKGAAVDRTAMHAEGRFRYQETDAFQAVALSYADPRYELVVMLPRAAAKPAAGWMAALDGARFTPREGKLALPKMKLDWSANVLAPLKAAGFAGPLGPGAKYSKLTAGPVAIGQVVHATRFVVDEQGTEAAAATAVTGVRSAGPAAAPFVMTVDRPFYLVLREKLTGAALFAGHVADPGESE